MVWFIYLSAAGGHYGELLLNTHSLKHGQTVAISLMFCIATQKRKNKDTIAHESK